MNVRGTKRVRGAAADEPERPVFAVVVGLVAETSPPGSVDPDLLRSIGWSLDTDPVVVSLEAARLRRAGLIERIAGGRYRLTPAGVDLLDDDF